MSLLESSAGVGVAAAIAAGAVSFLSPCVLPLVPAYVSYIAGESLVEGRARTLRQRAFAFTLSLCFVLGFSIVFIALGASATALGGNLLQYKEEANLVAGVVVIFFGLLLLGAARWLHFLQRDIRLRVEHAGANPLSAFVLGSAFAFGWTPCIGPILGSILTISAGQGDVATGVKLLAAYSIGLGLPFALTALFLQGAMRRLKALRGLGRRLQHAAGVVLIALGIGMITGRLTAFSYWLLQLFPGLGTIG